MKKIIITMALMAFSTGVHADVQPGLQAFKDGRWFEAAAQATQTGTAEGYSLACKSRLIGASYFSEGETAVRELHTALEDCERALSIDPEHLEARLSLALGMGYEVKRLSSVRLARATRRIMEQLVTLYPKDTLSAAGLAGWHGAVANAGFFARLILGGSKKSAIAWFGYSRTLGTWDIPLRFEYIKFRAKQGRKEREEALRELQILLATESDFAIDKEIQRRATELLPVLRSGSKSDVKATLNRVSAFPGIKEFSDYPDFDWNEDLWPGDIDVEDPEFGLKVENMSQIAQASTDG